MGNKRARINTGFSDLPYEILVQIFMCLSMLDIILGPSGVCRLWRKACCEPTLWRTINLDSMKSEEWFTPSRRKPNYPNGRYASRNIQLPVLRNALNLSGGEVDCLVFHSLMFLKDEHLVDTSARTKNLKRLVLPSWNLLNRTGMETAFKNWKNLESLTIPCFYYSCKIMRIIGAHCDNFRILKLACPLNLDLAEAIVEHVPGLKVLSLRYTKFYKDAIAHILNNLKHLEVLNLSHSHMAIRATRITSSNAIVVPIELSDREIIRRASKIKIFVACQDILSGRACKCLFSYEDLHEWHENNENLLLSK